MKLTCCPKKSLWYLCVMCPFNEWLIMICKLTGYSSQSKLCIVKRGISQFILVMLQAFIRWPKLTGRSHQTFFLQNAKIQWLWYIYTIEPGVLLAWLLACAQPCIKIHFFAIPSLYNAASFEVDILIQISLVICKSHSNFQVPSFKFWYRIAAWRIMAFFSEWSDLPICGVA